MIDEYIAYSLLFTAEALIAWIYLEYLFNRIKSFSVLACSFFLGHILLLGISRFNNTTVNALAFCFVNFILIRLNYQCSIKTGFLHTAFLCFIMIGAELLVNLLIGAFGYEFSAYTYDFSVMVVLMLLSKILYLLFSVIGSRIFVPHKHFNEEPRLMIVFCSMPLLSAFIAIIIAYLGMTNGTNETVSIMTLMIVVTLLIVNLIVFVLYNYLQKANEEYLTLQLSIQKEQADTAYYEALQEQFESQKILVHDIKKHLNTIAALAKNDKAIEIEKYISSIHSELLPSTHAKLCTDPILNLLLLRFRNDCQEKRILFHCDVRENVSTFMDASSITTLYGNLLSNALESAQCSQEKQIELSVTRNLLQSVIVITIVNSCDIEPTTDGNGGFCTKKSDNMIHGVGLKSISRVVKKYSGVATMYYDSAKNQFHHVIQFPLP